MSETVEAIVVGAGPGGLACAGALADSGVEVLVLDRAPAPGAKASRGVFHGRTSGPSLDDVFPSLLDEAPVERRLSSMRLSCLGEKRRARFSLEGLHAAEHSWSIAVDRPAFDAWLAKRVDERVGEEGGGVLMGVCAREPLVEDGEIVGVVTEELGEVRAGFVVAADGAGSVMARKAGLRGWGQPEDWFLQAHAVFASGEGSIEDEEDVLDLVAGGPLGELRGSGIVAPVSDGVRVEVWARLDAALEKGVGAGEALDALVAHPGVGDLVPEGAREVGFGASLVPDGRRVGLLAPSRGRLVAIGEAAGHGGVVGPLVDPRGVSGGILAARAFAGAREAGDEASVGGRFDALVGEHLGGMMSPSRSALAGGLVALARGASWLVSGRRVASLVNDPAWARALPDDAWVSSALPERLAGQMGEAFEEGGEVGVRSLEERLDAFDFDTDVGNPHVALEDDVAGGAVSVCPVSREGFTRGAFRVERPGGGEGFVALDWQACIECGACGVLEGVSFEHPRGGKGVRFDRQKGVGERG